MNLVAHWKFDGDVHDSTGNLNSKGHQIAFVEGVDGHKAGAVLFNCEKKSFIEVEQADSLNFGAGDFSIACWLKMPEESGDVNGDILSKFDPEKRRGFNMFISASSPGYSAASDHRSVGFGIDNGTPVRFEDCGKPLESNPIISTLTVYQGSLYTGLGDARDKKDACHVYRYVGGTKWVDCGRLGDDDRTPSVHSMVVHKGSLYAGTGVWDWDLAFEGIGGVNRVYRYLGGTGWEDCGSFGDGYRTMTLATFKGTLYAGDDHARLYRYHGGKSWEFAGAVNLKEARDQLNTLIVFGNKLYAGSNFGCVYEYDADKRSWKLIGDHPYHTVQVHTLQVYKGELYAGTWPKGHVLRYKGDCEWEDCGALGVDYTKFPINEVNELAVYNGKMYAGVLPCAEVYRYEKGTHWTLLDSLVKDPEKWDGTDGYTWYRAPGMAVFNGKLFVGTSTCHGGYVPDLHKDAGRVFSLEAGKCVTLDNDFGRGWNHFAAVKEGSYIKLFVNGILRASTDRFDTGSLNVNNSSPLLIGFGAQNYLSGALDDLRIYQGALSEDALRNLLTL